MNMTLPRSETEFYQSRPSLWLAFDAWVMSFIISLVTYMLNLQAMIILYSFTGIELNPNLAFIIPGITILFAIWKTLVILCTKYTFTNQRVIIKTGVLSTEFEEVEISRIRDFKVTQPFALRILGLGNITIYSADMTTAEIDIKAQKNINELRDALRQAVIQRQTELGYKEYEVT